MYQISGNPYFFSGNIYGFGGLYSVRMILPYAQSHPLGYFPSSIGEYLNPIEQSTQKGPKTEKRFSCFKRGPYKKYSLDLRQLMNRKLMDGQSIKKLADEFGIPKRNLLRWKRESLNQRQKTLLQSVQIDQKYKFHHIQSSNVWNSIQLPDEHPLKFVNQIETPFLNKN